jgi:hypothetical protein
LWLLLLLSVSLSSLRISLIITRLCLSSIGSFWLVLRRLVRFWVRAWMGHGTFPEAALARVGCVKV